MRGLEDSYSANWSGYAQVASARSVFTEMTDTFVVPTVATTLPGKQFVADWVGIGGYEDSGLVQTGIQAEVRTVRHQRMVTYDAWTEHLPQAEKPLALTVSPGDTITATVQETATNVWDMVVTDDTTSQSAGRVADYKSSGESAEAINERPCIKTPCTANHLAELAQTSDITFDPGFYSVTPPGQAPVLQPLLAASTDTAVTLSLYDVVMTNNSQTADIATPSAPDSSGQGFTVADGAVAPDPPSV